MTQTATCRNCNKQFPYSPTVYGVTIPKHCSMACRTAYGRVTTICPQCGNEFVHARSQPRTYCSHQCANSAALARQPTQGVATLACEQCGKTFTRPNSENKKVAHHFCSQRCFGDWLRTNGPGTANFKGTPRPLKRTKYTCSQCGKAFWRSPAVARDYTDKFCNRTCKAVWQKAHPPEQKLAPHIGPDNPRWKGGPYNRYYGPNWRPQRRNARRRDKYTCQRCGITETELGRQLDVHHIIPFRTFGRERYSEANRLSNLLSLCVSCHLIVEHEQNKHAAV